MTTRTTPLFHRGHYNKLSAILGRRMAVVEFESMKKDYGGLVPVLRAVLDDLANAMSWEFIEDNEEFDEGRFFANIKKHYEDYKAVLGLGHTPPQN